MEKIKYNITQNRDFEVQLHNLKNIDNHYIFYYDETNNIRKFWFKSENKLNIPIGDLTKNFVLGGLLHKKDVQLDLDDLKNRLNLQKSIKEIKLDHIAKGDFLACLNSEKLEIILDWLNTNDLYIHYSSLNILYWSLVDIIDSVIHGKLFEISNELKTVLYEIIKLDLEAALTILYKYEYPNINRELAQEFLDDLSKYIEINIVKFIQKYPDLNIEFIKLILSLLENRDNRDLTFIMDEKTHILIDGLGEFYLRPLGLFKNSIHIFDEENTIEEFMNKFDLYDEDNILINFEFKNSKDSLLIQFSDVITGLMGKFFDYINNLTFEEIDTLQDILNEKQKKNIATIADLLLKSDKQSTALTHSIQGLIDRDKFSMVLQKFLVR
jgi:hypothetical protein